MSKKTRIFEKASAFSEQETNLLLELRERVQEEVGASDCDQLSNSDRYSLYNKLTHEFNEATGRNLDHQQIRTRINYMKSKRARESRADQQPVGLASINKNLAAEHMIDAKFTDRRSVYEDEGKSVYNDPLNLQEVGSLAELRPRDLEASLSSNEINILQQSMKRVQDELAAENFERPGSKTYMSSLYKRLTPEFNRATGRNFDRQQIKSRVNYMKQKRRKLDDWSGCPSLETQDECTQGGATDPLLLPDSIDPDSLSDETTADSLVDTDTKGGWNCLPRRGGGGL